MAIRELFAHPVLARSGAAALESAAQAAAAADHALRSAAERLPLSFAQQRLWFLAQMEGVSEAYHIPFGLRLEGELDQAALRRALDRMVARHEALRTTFRVGGRRAGAADHSRRKTVASCWWSTTCASSRMREAELERLMAAGSAVPVRSGRGPLIRGRLIRLAEEEHVLLITMHHIVSDGWSMGILLRRAEHVVRRFLRGEADPLPELEIQYADYAVWQRQWMEGEVLQRQAEYWKSAWRERRRCWSCRRTIRGRRSRTMPGRLRSWCWTRS